MPKPRAIPLMFEGWDQKIWQPKDAQTRPGLYLEVCSYDAAKYAVEHWHYSGVMPPFPMTTVGAWHDGAFLGVVVFSRGANKDLGSPYGLTQDECWELTRVALTSHPNVFVSAILVRAIRLFRRETPSCKLLISFADPAQGHAGKIYQATNWLYLGETGSSYIYIDKSGNKWHPRMVSPTGLKRSFGDLRVVVKSTDCERVKVPGKHRYAMPFDPDVRKQLASKAKPYPSKPVALEVSA